MNKHWWWAIVLLALILTACIEFEDDFIEGDEDEQSVFVDESQPESADNRPEELDSAECPFSRPGGFEISCGFLQVPENRTREDSRMIELAYVIVAAEQDEGLDPVVYLAGGPGGSAIDDFLSDPEGWRYPFTRSRDLILIDQRGTGYSWPTLDCPELAEQVEFGDRNPELDCRDRLVAEGVDLTAYNTAENAADVAALQEELGIDSWDLLGISYGTRLALNIMRDHPEGVRAVVLDSVFPPNADTPGDEALSPYWSLQTLFADCASDTYCDDAYPELEDVFIDTVLALNETPVDDLFGDDFVFMVTIALNDTELIPLLPYVIYSVAEGDLDALDELEAFNSSSLPGRFQADTDRSDSEGMYNSVICHDEYVFGDYDEIEAQLVAELPDAIEAALLQPVVDLFQLCSFWGAGEAAGRENEPVSSDIPTLILAGQYDHATPPEWADLTATTLANAFVYKFPDAGHSLLSGHECAIAITADFLDTPGQAPDSGCIADISWPEFE